MKLGRAFDSLPTEITSEIFIHFLPVYPDCPPLTGPRSPILLTHICHKWRDIALATPALWRAISFSTTTDFWRATPNSTCTTIIPFTLRLEIFNLWLSRSGHCPLSIEVDMRPKDPRLRNVVQQDPEAFAPPTAKVAQFVAAAALHSARWEYLELCISTDVFPIIETPMPLLRSLTLFLNDYPRAHEISSFHTLPLLRTLVLHLDNYLTPSFDLPWAQLTSLTLNSALPSDCSSFLQQTPNLVHCELQVVDDGFGRPPDVTLPRLESLTFCENFEDPVAWYLDTLIVPALRSLRTTERFLGPNQIQALSSIISKSGSNLQSICISNIKAVSEDSYRQAFPAISNFSFPSTRRNTSESANTFYISMQ
ncbi:hypothetical protein C8R47DRAFT_1210291 [Mycena vitilis]|nr:hypothetical protein C8R47DRAFT_1210291 [Mycena vitilis]